MACFAMKFPLQYLEISIKKSKNWNGNSNAKRVIFFQFSHYQVSKDESFTVTKILKEK